MEELAVFLLWNGSRYTSRAKKTPSLPELEEIL